MRQVGKHRRSNLTAKRAEAALTLLLTGCTDERFAGFTAAQLAATHNVRLTKAEAMLERARQGRP